MGPAVLDPAGALVPLGGEICFLGVGGGAEKHPCPRENRPCLEGGPCQGQLPSPGTAVHSVGTGRRAPLEWTSLKAVPSPGLPWG